MTEDVQDVQEAEDAPIEQDQADHVEADQVEAEQPVREWDDETEQNARAFGWKPPEEWVGDIPAGYIDNPKEWVERIQRSPVFKTMSERMERQERAQEEAMRKLSAMQDRALQQQRQQYESQMQRIVAAQREAVDNADPERFDQLEQQRQRLSQMATDMQQPQQVEPDRAVVEYAESERGAWLKNPVLLNTAKSLIDGNPKILSASAQEQIEYAEAEVRKMYPAYFPDDTPSPEPKPKAPPRVDAGGLGGKVGRATGFSALPADAKSQFKKFVEQGIYSNTKADQEEYANEYNAA